MERDSDLNFILATTNQKTNLKPPAVVRLGTSAFPCGETSFLDFTAAEMQTGTLDGSPSKHTPEIQPTADANARWAGTRTIRTYDLRSAIRFGYILY